MRKSIDTLCILISDQLDLNPTDGHLFIFRNKSGNKFKCLYYEPNCFSLWYRRSERNVVFDYQQSRGGYHAEAFLKGFKGYLQTDAYSGYHVVAKNKDIVSIGCIAHAR